MMKRGPPVASRWMMNSLRTGSLNKYERQMNEKNNIYIYIETIR